jgi:hypothetical protein
VKLFRLLALMLAIGVVPMFSILTQAQQEVDPDHYEQGPVAQAKGPAAKAQVAQKGAAHHSHTRLASKHSGRVNHHRTRVSA